MVKSSVSNVNLSVSFCCLQPCNSYNLIFWYSPGFLKRFKDPPHSKSSLRQHPLASLLGHISSSSAPAPLQLLGLCPGLDQALPFLLIARLFPYHLINCYSSSSFCWKMAFQEGLSWFFPPPPLNCHQLPEQPVVHFVTFVALTIHIFLSPIHRRYGRVWTVSSIFAHCISSMSFCVWHGVGGQWLCC